MSRDAITRVNILTSNYNSGAIVSGFRNATGTKAHRIKLKTCVFEKVLTSFCRLCRTVLARRCRGEPGDVVKSGKL